MKTILLLVFCHLSFASEIRLPVKSLPTELDLDNMVQVDQHRIAKLLSETLFETSDNFEVVPKLAKSFAWKNQGKELEIKIDKTYFSDGKLISIYDVERSLRKCIRGSLQNNPLIFSNVIGMNETEKSYNQKIPGLTIVNETTLSIKLVKRSPLILDNLSQASCSITKEENNRKRDLLNGSIASGPYIIKNRTANELVLVKNSYFAKVTSGPNTIVIKDTGKYGDFKKLYKDFDLILTENEIKDSDFTDYNFSNLSFYNLTFNTSIKPLNNLEIRKTVSDSLNFQFLADNLKWNSNRLQEGFFPFGMRGFKKRTLSKNSLIQAQEILRKYNYSKNNPLELLITIGESSISDLEKNVWPRAFENPALTIKVEVLSNSEVVSKRENGDFQILRTSKVPGSIDPHLLLASYVSNSKFNTARSVLPQCDYLIKKSLEIANKEKRFIAYTMAEKCLLENHILIPLASSNPGKVLLRKPWVLTRSNQYLLYPYSVYEWKKNL